MRKKPSEVYLEKARLLTREEAERLMSRMRARSMCMMHDEEPSTLECVAIQLETEDEQLREWRAKMVELRKKERRLGV